MNRILFVCPYPLGQSPSQRFRFEQYFSLLKKEGISVETRTFLKTSDWIILYRKGFSIRKAMGVIKGGFSRLFTLFTLNKFDFIFIHREAAPLGPPVIEWIIAKVLRKKIIYDFDDAIWLPNTSLENKIASSFKWHNKVMSICRWSYKVSCGNRYLANYAERFNSNVVINPTTIDTLDLHNPDLYPETTDPSLVTIGWTGSHSTIPYLLPALPIIESLWKRYPHIRLLVIADKDPGWNLPFTKFIKWNKETEIQDLMKIDIGIMPLPDEEWAKGKCGFKALQYMSLRKPAIVSPVGANKEIVEHDVSGYHCETNDDWFQRLEYLIQNKDKCKLMGEEGRRRVKEHYSVLSNSSNFLSLFE